MSTPTGTDPAAGPGYGSGSGRAIPGADRGDQRRDHLVQVADYGVVGVRDDWRLGIGVDRHDVLGGQAPGHVLDRAADPAGEVQLGGDAGAGLAHLLLVRPPALAGDD